ncbi:MAG: 3-isopropylmalate dehydratase small subunit [Porticoccaceae bacterium]|nr:3-isopropylmalate dehydratase small subunit [Porticoccaceae bacterium]
MIEPFITHLGLVAPLDRINVDTDMIIPKQFLKSIKRTGFGKNLFDELRYLDEGYPGQDCKSRPLNMEFSLNNPRYKDASVLLTRKNFGCGSSREHAAWALRDYGFKVIVAPSFADIFYNNCIKNGLLPVTLLDSEIDSLFEQLFKVKELALDIDLPNQTVKALNGIDLKFSFCIDSFYKHCLINGLDEIALTLQDSKLIKEFESAHAFKFPWTFGAIK